MNAPSLEELADLATPWAIRVVITLGVPELLADGTRSSEDLAVAAGCDATYLRRMLAHLAGRGLFRQERPGWFALTEAGQQLRGDGARLGYGLDGVGGRFAHAWTTLADAVREGRPVYAEKFGRPFWEDLAAHPELSADFDAMMGPAGHGEPDPRILPEEAWAGASTIVDVGGGAGYKLAALLKARPELRGTLVELPPTAARAEQVLAEAGLADRSEVVAQSFFDPLPAGADLYLLSSIINDFPDPEAAAILTRCAEAAGRTGRVLVRGAVADDDHQPSGLEVELVLLGGRVRGPDEFAALAARAGLAVRALHDQPAGLVAELIPD
ncbi:methyltransferase [Microlunatus sp. GCM10028923]|uniref:methyltransferase n=1 Tax=Microlunatus sp. GCM10028923 TaxID=3273400 RepID=UPI0036200A05